MTYYLQDHPNPNTPQYGWERARLNQPGVHLSGVIGVHTSEAITDFEGVDNNAENNAAFIARRGEYGSYHTTGDADSILPLVHPRYAAWADITNNAHAMSVSGCLQAARWLEMTPERRAAVVRNMAYAAAEMVLTAVRDGYLPAPTPAVRISAEEAISGSRPGFYGHGETNPGTRYDPGVHFDWGLFLSTYATAIRGDITPQGTTTPKEWDEMASKEEIKEAIREESGNFWFTNAYGRPVQLWSILNAIDKNVNGNNDTVQGKLDRLIGETVGLRAAVAALSVGSSVTPEQVESAIKDALSDFTITLAPAKKGDE